MGDLPDWTRAFLLIGQNEAGDPVPVLVTDDGNLYAVLQGQGATGLQTIAVDENGRIQVFTLDDENQWGEVLRVGNAEASARLGSPVTWDWRGNTLWLDQLDNGLGEYYQQTSGTGAAIALNPVYRRFGGYSAKLTGGSDGDRYAALQFTCGSLPADRIGLAIAFSINTATGYVELILTDDIGASSPEGRVRLDIANSKVQYLVPPFTWVDAQSVSIPASSNTFNWLKLVIDTTAKEYERVLFNDQEIDLSGIGTFLVTTSTAGRVVGQIFNYSRSGQNDDVYVDCVILSVNEPVNS